MLHLSRSVSSLYQLVLIIWQPRLIVLATLNLCYDTSTSMLLQISRSGWWWAGMTGANNRCIGHVETKKTANIDVYSKSYKAYSNLKSKTVVERIPPSTQVLLSTPRPWSFKILVYLVATHTQLSHVHTVCDEPYHFYT